MQRDHLLRYGTVVPLPLILDHPQFGAMSKLGVELRRAAARLLNEAATQAGFTRLGLAREAGVDYGGLTLVCTGRQAMDVEILKRALQALGKDWRTETTRFEEAVDYRGRGRFQ